LGHLISGQKSLREIALTAPGGFVVIPGGSGLQELTQLTESQFTRVITSFNELDGMADILLLDTGAGISRDVSNFLLAADEVIIVTTPEPHAMTDAYAIIK
jgi:ATPases involved in chromosome partitioning